MNSEEEEVEEVKRKRWNWLMIGELIGEMEGKCERDEVGRELREEMDQIGGKKARDGK